MIPPDAIFLSSSYIENSELFSDFSIFNNLRFKNSIFRSGRNQPSPVSTKAKNMPPLLKAGAYVRKISDWEFNLLNPCLLF
jgi:hypothetical protein